MEQSERSRWRIAAWLALGAAAAVAVALQTKRYLETPVPDTGPSAGPQLRIDASDAVQVARGRQLYAQACASCHGAQLEGQPNWRQRLPDGRMPAPPHDASGHTWHHADAVLFAITKHGLVPGVTAPPGYQSDMPAFGTSMTDDDIVAVLAYIKSTWPDNKAAAQREVTDQHAKPR
ncbi:cytochrome c [Cupriavidus gilardii]|uniref:c-type cytochrome n=1 Tax=Cupriavidus TaxID=106589 RepID=UPI0011EC72A3|nr:MULTISPECIES: cytochrome c [Cupriavidus]KAA0178779.1 cytochrome c [Cupriavidus gilardii]MBO4120643.1 cytochrome c [Cupriavidus gilardii]MCA7082499.1 cytochrome c [Cupriavidus sp. DB3]MCT9119129.1 cytochrome c [Cupriavidus gilardii]MCT9124963.1 cytochrome c [Cupriavidus gilardii]